VAVYFEDSSEHLDFIKVAESRVINTVDVIYI
jgi:hypothetical protein